MTRLCESFDAVPEREAPLVLAIGAFDGIHLGHRAVINHARALSTRLGARVGVLRFHPHPSRILRPEHAPPLLCNEAQVHELLDVDLHLRLPFTATFANQAPLDFLRMLAEGLPGLRGVVTGPNWRFGRAGGGDVSLLRDYAATRGWLVETAADTLWRGQRISSTRIRRALADGNLEEAAAMLGRPYRISGIVCGGKRLGRALGFPTANLVPEQDLCPPGGVYAMRVLFPDGGGQAAGYLTHDPALAEVHLLKFDGDLYGSRLDVDVLHFRRPAQDIADLGRLREVIAEDVRAIRAWFAEEGA